MFISYIFNLGSEEEMKNHKNGGETESKKRHQFLEKDPKNIKEDEWKVEAAGNGVT